MTLLRNGDIDWRANGIYTLLPKKPREVEAKQHLHETINAFGTSVDISGDRVTAEWNILGNWDVAGAKLQGVGRLAGTAQCLDLFPKSVQTSAMEQMFVSDGENDGESDPDEDDEMDADEQDAGVAKTPTPRKPQRRKNKDCSEKKDLAVAQITAAASPTAAKSSSQARPKSVMIPGIETAQIAGASWVQNALSTN